MIGNQDNHLIEQAINPTFAAKKAHVGMPPLARRAKEISYFEFWPTSIVYLPIVFLWLFQSVRYRGLTVPLCANPGFFLGGLVGESKADNLLQAGPYSRELIAPWCKITNDRSDVPVLLKKVQREMDAAGLSFPIIAKPDVGCRGEGVRIVRNQEQLQEYFSMFPEQASIILQELILWEPEAGIFYMRMPGERCGKIFSLTLKYQPFVYGNGVDTLRTLIEQDSRAGKLVHLYTKRHESRLDDVLKAGQPYRLAFAGSHCRGAIFRDGCDLITEELTKAFDRVSKDIDGFYFGRCDVRFADERSLRNGRNFRIVEVNGISSEAAHIWDPKSSLLDVYKTLFRQYNTLFKIGAENRARGYRPDSVINILKGWMKERRLSRQYPETE